MLTGQMPETGWFFGRRGKHAIDRYTRMLPGSLDGPSPFADVAQKFVICCTSRTGSTLLCRLLQSYGAESQEFLNPQRVEIEKALSGARNYRELCAHLVRAYAPGKAFGLKGTFQVVAPLFLISEFPDNLDGWRFVFLTRANLVRQAISMILAQKQQAYASWQEPIRAIGDADYVAEEIAGAIEIITLGNAWWESFFANFGVEPLRITYEQLAADQGGTAETVSRFCGLTQSGGHADGEPRGRPLSRQSTELNLRWEARFRAEMRSLRVATFATKEEQTISME